VLISLTTHDFFASSSARNPPSILPHQTSFVRAEFEQETPRSPFEQHRLLSFLVTLPSQTPSFWTTRPRQPISQVNRSTSSPRDSLEHHNLNPANASTSPSLTSKYSTKSTPKCLQLKSRYMAATPVFPQDPRANTEVNRTRTVPSDLATLATTLMSQPLSKSSRWTTTKMRENSAGALSSTSSSKPTAHSTRWTRTCAYLLNPTHGWRAKA
jgi:hypothetical protein